MEQSFNLPKLGGEELRVGRLLDGEVPIDDDERWALLEAPLEHLQLLLEDHLRAQALLRACRDSGQPFALFLRSFSAEYKPRRDGKNVLKQFSMSSVRFQEWIAKQLGPAGIPLIKLHGGSDSLLADLSGSGSALSTDAASWEAVAAELIRAASVIILLISYATPGVVRELELIRESERTQSCLAAVADPAQDAEVSKLLGLGNDTSDQDVARWESVRANLTDFANVVELPSFFFSVAPDSYPGELKQDLMRLISGARTQAQLDRALTVEFSYLEHDFVNSGGFTAAEEELWSHMRLLRVTSNDIYWNALKARGIDFHWFSHPGPWILAHRLYGLAIETADFRALAEILFHIGQLSVYRGADFALNTAILAQGYEQLGRQIFPGGPPDTESQYANGPDPLQLPATMPVAVSISKVAEEAWQRQDPATAAYYYQAAVVSALRATDKDDKYRSAIIGDMAQVWAGYQAVSGQSEWALANYNFALSLYRDLAAVDHEHYVGGLAVCLNNLGGYYYKRADLQSADACFVEALEIRLSLPSGQEGYQKHLTVSLMNLGLVRTDLGDYDSARALYRKSLELCRERLRSEPEAIIDLTRQQALMSLCLTKIPAARNEASQYARQAENGLSSVAKISPEAAAALRAVIEQAKRAISTG